MLESLTDLLVRSRLLAPIQAEQIIQRAEMLQVPVVSVLLESGIVHEDVLLQQLQTTLQLQLYDPDKPPSTEALRLLSQQEAERMLVLPLERHPGQLVVAMVDPLDHRAFEEMVFLTGREIRPLLGRYSDVVRGIQAGYRKVATRVMSDVVGSPFGGDLDTEQLETQPEHQSLKLLFQRLEALVQVLEDKGLISREELTLALRDLDLEEEED